MEHNDVVWKGKKDLVWLYGGGVIEAEGARRRREEVSNRLGEGDVEREKRMIKADSSIQESISRIGERDTLYSRRMDRWGLVVVVVFVVVVVVMLVVVMLVVVIVVEVVVVVVVVAAVVLVAVVVVVKTVVVEVVVVVVVVVPYGI